MRRNTTAICYTVMQTAIWGSYGFLISYANRYLLDRGLTDWSVGLILGIATGLSFLLQPLLTLIVDRTRLSCRSVLVLSAGLMGISSLSLLLFRGIWGQILLYAAACVSLQVIPAFSNALGMAANQRGKGLNFGLARGIGSVSFGLCAQAAVPLIDRFGLPAIPVCTAVLSLLLLLSTLPFGDEKQRDPEKIPSSVGEFFRGHKSFAVFLLSAVLLYTGHNALSNCMFQVAEFKGDGSAQGTALMIAATVELPTMFLFTRMLRRMSCGKWVCLSGVFFTLRLILTLTLPGVVGLYVSQLAQMLGFALFAVSSVYYVNSVVEKRDVVKGQAYLGVANTLGCLVAHFMGGALIDLWEVDGMLLTCAGISAVGMLLLFASTEKKQTTP